MANVQFTWTLPVSSPDPIDHFRLERLDGANPPVLVEDNIAPTVTTVTASGQPTGAQSYQLVSVSADGDEAAVATGLTVVNILPATVIGFSASSV